MSLLRGPMELGLDSEVGLQLPGVALWTIIRRRYVLWLFLHRVCSCKSSLLLLLSFPCCTPSEEGRV